MDFLSDMLLIAGCLGVGFYCFVLSRRLTRFTDLEKGVGGAVAVLSVQVDDLTKALASARSSASDSGAELDALTKRAEGVSRALEMHIASLHDIPLAQQPDAATTPAPQAPPTDASPEPPLRAVRAMAPHEPDRSVEVSTPAPSPSPVIEPDRVASPPPVQSFFASHRRPSAGAVG